MSFSTEVKNELARTEIEKKCCQLAELAGFLRVSGSLRLAGAGKFKIVVTTEIPAVARHYKRLIKEYFKVDAKLEIGEGSGFNKQRSYLLTIGPEERSEQILRDGGAWVSEYPPGVKPYRQAFVARNRIIAGLSAATIVIEAGEHSGSLSTANYALESGREVFACPGRLTDPESIGCHKLIEEQRAHLYLGASLMMKELGWGTLDEGAEAHPFSAPHAEKPAPSSPTREYPPHPLLAILIEQGMLSVDELSRLSGMDLMTVRSELFDLELDGWVQARAGGCYSLC